MCVSTIPPGRTALIRLAAVEGLDKQSCPAIVCCGGRMDLHGAPMSRTWVKLGATARPGDAGVRLAEFVRGWRAGDRVVVTTSGSRGRINSRVTLRPGAPAGRDRRKFAAGSEERAVKAIDAHAGWTAARKGAVTARLKSHLNAVVNATFR